MKPDRDHAAIEAIARKLRDAGCPHPDAVAPEIMAVVRGYGYRYVIEPPPARTGGGLPTPGSQGAELLAKVRAEVRTALEDGHDFGVRTDALIADLKKGDDDG